VEVVLIDTCRRPSRQGGFSVVEVLITAALLLVVAVGIVPLFTASLGNNRAGYEASEVSNHARSRLEEFMQLPFNSPDLTLQTGTERQFVEYFSLNDQTWKSGVAPPADPALWIRTTTLRQYGFDLDPTQGTTSLTTPLPASAAPAAVHLKEVEVRIDSPRLSGALGPGKSVVVRTYKSQ
jgi:Tfp pilus assembly protein PilV